MKNYDIIIIGGGPAGLAAAISAYDNGSRDILILEREPVLGGILNQCIHNGFGLTRFKESLTGPEYAYRFVEEVRSRGIEYMCDTTVLEVSTDKQVTAINSTKGVFSLSAKAIILAMGCRERSRGALNIAGTRPAGIYSAGTAQKYVNILGQMPGKRVVILGSGDIGLIMARRMTLEGAKVLAVCEIMPHSSGLKRNIVQCLDDYGIPLYLSHTIVKIEGKDRVSGVYIAQVDEKRRPIEGTEKYFECDTVLFSVGLIPENELSKGAGVNLSPATKGPIVYDDRETSVSGIFACGNVLHVHDLVDFVSEEAEIAGVSASNYAMGKGADRRVVSTTCGNNVSYVLPQMLDTNASGMVKLYFRVNKVLPNPTIRLTSNGEDIVVKKKKIAVPGEMESVVLTPAKLQSISGDVVVSVEE
ncbi:MAG: FAD-dependent oxidoreductase [Clostridia bacterium]|nr:FAD-dependent oxidoreductase [Clostridia bacterium]